jgi:Polyketide cyclase / dehydrase and lipid transport
MAKLRLERPLHASVEVSAAPGEVWRVAADLRRTREWSPECSRVIPLGRVHQGGWLLGLNRRGWVRWATLSQIVRYEQDREIAWKVLTNRSVWTYRLEPTDAGTKITETRETPDGIGRFARAFTEVLLGGQQLHDDELEAGMTCGLEKIRAVAEGRAASNAESGS